MSATHFFSITIFQRAFVSDFVDFYHVKFLEVRIQMSISTT